MTERLVSLGFITQNTNPENRRSDILELTPSGHAILEKVLDVWRKADGMIIAALGKERAEHFIALATELRNALGGSEPKKEVPKS